MKYNTIISSVFFLASLSVCLGYTFIYNQKGDETPPVIHVADEAYHCSIEATDEELLAGITADDQEDGDLTDQIFVESLSNLIDDNTRVLSVAVIDSAENVAKGKRVIVYDDYSSPKFSMTQPLQFYVGTREITEFIKVQDLIDGDLSDKVKPCSPYHLAYETGDYPMEFMVSNSAGDVSRFQATVTLNDNFDRDRRADISLSEYLVYVKKGEKLSPWSYVQGVTLNGHEYSRKDKDLLPDTQTNYNWTGYPDVIRKADFKIEDSVDYENEGCYEILYSYSTENYSGSVRLVVIVQ